METNEIHNHLAGLYFRARGQERAVVLTEQEIQALGELSRSLVEELRELAIQKRKQEANKLRANPLVRKKRIIDLK